MKAFAPILACFLLFASAGAVHALEFAELNSLLGQAMGDEAKTCAVIKLLNREIAANPGDERLLNLRVNTYRSLYDPYSAKPDVDALAALHPDAPGMQLVKCMYEEATGADKSAFQACYLRVAALCEKLGKADAHSHEYLLALLLAESPAAAAAKQRFLDALTDSLMDQELRKTITNFSRESMIRKVDPSEIRHPCAQAR